jgi:hypothetical protein
LARLLIYFRAKAAQRMKKNSNIKGGKVMGIREKFERIMMAITFAEAGEHDTAREFLQERKRPRKQERPRRRPRPQMRAPSADR